MRFILFLCLLLSLPSFLLSEEKEVPAEVEQVILPELKGIYLLKCEDDVATSGLRMTGVDTKDVCVPGGLDALKDELEPRFIGNPLTQNAITEIKRAIILFWRKHDHPVVMVEVPEQDVTMGVLQLRNKDPSPRMSVL